MEEKEDIVINSLALYHSLLKLRDFCLCLAGPGMSCVHINSSKKEEKYSYHFLGIEGEVEHL